MKVHSQEDMIKQILWENHQVEEGVARYKQSLEDKTLEETKGGMSQFKKAMPQTIEALKAAYKEADVIMFAKDGGNKPSWPMLIGLVKPEQTAAITLNCMLKHVTTPDHMLSLTTLALQIGKSLREQLMFENWKKNEKAIQDEHNATCEEGDTYSKSYAELLIERAKNNMTRSTLARWKKKFNSYNVIEWPHGESVAIGMKLMNVCLEANPDLFMYKMPMIKGKKTRILHLTESAWAHIQGANDSALFSTPLLLPTLIEPLEWHYNNSELKGGYHHIARPLFSERMNKHTAADVDAPSQEFLDSINNVQNTAWTINPYINMVVNMIVGTGKELGGVPRMCELVAPKLPEEEYNAMTKEERRSYLKNRSTIIEEIASQRGKHGAFVRKLNIASKLLPHSKFFFPHFADFRGRLYPMAQELTPQGDQVAKGLLQFAEAKELGKDGMYWLKVHAANTFGKDKESLDDRVKWATDNLDMMAECAIDPLTNKTWAKADEPLPFLAVCKELTDAHELAFPFSFKSHIAVAMDGTCNGMQLLSLLGRDNLGAEKTNCRSIDSRFDLYSEVAAKVIAICKREMFGNSVAGEWYKKLHNNPSLARKTVKRAVMTTPYGVTGRGIAQQLVGDKHCNDLGDVSRANASDYMKDCILEAMSEVNGKAVEIMGYFQNIAGTMAQQQQPLSWYTPMGLKVTQAYYKMADKRIQTVFGTVVLWAEDKAMGLDAQKQYQSSAPNVIHSFDAAMLQLTVTELTKKGHTAFAMIHDSYGMHAGNVEELHATLRMAAYEIFSADQMAEFHAYVQSQTEIQLPKPPVAGDYDMAEILNAPYFFS